MPGSHGTSGLDTAQTDRGITITGQRTWFGQRRWFALVVPLLALLVATTQFVVASTSELTAWRGAGFGMFSTIDNHSVRFVRLSVDIAGEARPVAIDSLGSDEQLRRGITLARAWPRDDYLDALAAQLAGHELVEQGDGVLGLAGPADDADAPTVRIDGPVSVQVIRLNFDQRSHELTPEVINQRTVVP